MILASSVVYSTLVSMVPFLAFTMALFSAFGVINEVQNYIQEYLLMQFGEAVETSFIELVEGFLLNAGSLGVIGLISFMITSVFLLNRVWMTVNQIYRTSLHTNLLLRMARFITVLVISTLLLSAYVSVVTIIRRELLLSEEVVIAIRLLRVFAPWALMFLVLFFLILIVPNTKVKASSAAIGSLLGLVLFQISNTLFMEIVNRVLNYSIIYGSFAALLVFLLWVYLVWIIIFMAVEISYVHQYQPKRSVTYRAMESPLEVLAHGIDVLAEIASAYKRGEGPVSSRELSLRLSIPDEKMSSYISILERSGFIIRTDKGGRSCMPARPLEDIRMHEAVKIMFGTLETGMQAATPGTVSAQNILAAGLDQIKDQSLLSFIREKKPRQTAAGGSKKSGK